MEEDDKFMKSLQEELNRKMEDINSRPVEEMDNLSPIDMHHILDFTFDSNSPIGFKEKIDDEILEQIPFLNLSIFYLNIIDNHKELKLTTRGNLPRKICFQLYETGIIKEDFIENGIVKLNKEGDSVAIQNIKIINLLNGNTKKRNNKISLTAKGKKLLFNESKKELLKSLFQTNCKEFNLGYHDGYPQDAEVQRLFGYTLYLLLKYGNEKRKFNFNIEKNLMAFPFILEKFEERWTSREKQFEHCYSVRIFERFLQYYNFITYINKRSPLSNKEPIDINTTDIFNGVFELKKNNFQFKKSKHSA